MMSVQYVECCGAECTLVEFLWQRILGPLHIVPTRRDEGGGKISRSTDATTRRTEDMLSW